jgi:hypothetical protein
MRSFRSAMTFFHWRGPRAPLAVNSSALFATMSGALLREGRADLRRAQDLDDVRVELVQHRLGRLRRREDPYQVSAS